MKNPKTTIRILCVDDHPLVREGIARKISRQHDMRMVGTASTGEEGVALFRRHLPDIVLMDLQLPGIRGTHAIELIREIDANAKIIVLTVCGGEEDIFRAIHAGAASYLMKETLSNDLISIVRRVYAGERPLPDGVAERMASRVGLSPREVDVLELIADGKRNKEIADVLGITQETVQTHIKKLFHKLGVNDRTAAVTAAISRGIVHIQ
jgi:two-component system, NarL family, response regulator